MVTQGFYSRRLLSREMLRRYKWNIGLSLLFILGLFPSRNHLDTVTALQLARAGESSNQWTAIYFRFLEATSLFGKYPFISAIIGFVMLMAASIFFIYSLPISEKSKFLSQILVSATPFVGVFGMTLTHEVQTVTGTLVLTGVLIRKEYLQSNAPNYLLVFLSIVLCLMTFVGTLIAVGFLLALLNRNNMGKVGVGVALLVTSVVLSDYILRVDRVDSATNLQAILGDMKCIAQHPDSNTTAEQWRALQSFGDREEWTNPTTCSVTSVTVLFTAKQVQGRELELIGLWMELVKQNPQIALQARIQRSAMALPPPFFQSQPNYSSRDFLEPVGLGTQDDLQQWSPIFKTSNDDPYQLENFPAPSISKPLEYMVLLPAFVFNSQSWFWGWGGLWFLVFLVILIARTRLSYPSIFRVTLPHAFTIIGLFVGSPVSDPRYAMTLTCVGLFTSIAFLVDYLVKRKETL